MFDKQYNFIKENISHPIAFFCGLIPLGALIKFIDNLISDYITLEIKLIIYCVPLLFWLIGWLILRSYFPKNKDGFLGICIAIKTENNKQKIRLKNDFLKQLIDIIKENNLEELIHIVYLNQNQAIRFNKVIDGIKGSDKEWKKIRKKIRAHFYIFGDIKERKDGNNKYFIDLNSLVVHSPLNPINQAKMSRGLGDAWVRQYSFAEDFEFKGFKFSANYTFIGVRYIIGLAALLSGDASLALQLHKNLYEEILAKNLQNKIPNKILPKLKLLIATEYQVLARYYYEKQLSYPMAKENLNNSFKYQNNNYGALLLKSILEYVHDNNAEKALLTINKAKSYSRGDGTWKYNKAFLLFTLEKFDEGFEVYLNISRNTFKNERNIAEQSIHFNILLFEQNPSHIQSLFIIGYLYLEKLNNPPISLEYFEKFIVLTKNKKSFKFLRKKAEIHIRKINSLLQI